MTRTAAVGLCAGQLGAGQHLVARRPGAGRSRAASAAWETPGRARAHDLAVPVRPVTRSAAAVVKAATEELLELRVHAEVDRPGQPEGLHDTGCG